MKSQFQVALNGCAARIGIRGSVMGKAKNLMKDNLIMPGFLKIEL